MPQSLVQKKTLDEFLKWIKQASKVVLLLVGDWNANVGNSKKENAAGLYGL